MPVRHSDAFVPSGRSQNALARMCLVVSSLATTVDLRSPGCPGGTAAPAGPNAPLSMWSNRWSTMPVHALSAAALPRPDARAVLNRMPGSSVPVIRQPFGAHDPLPFWAWGPFDGNHCWDLADDPAEERDLAGTAVERRLADALRAALETVEAPPDQLVRLGLG